MAESASQPRGFTLIELLIVIAIIGVVAAAVAPALSSFTGANARSAAGEIAGESRYLYDTAALRHETCRLAIDMDKRSWWAECTDSAKEGRRRQPVLGRDGSAEDDEAALARRVPGEKDPAKLHAMARARFGEIQKRRSLPGSVAFGGVWTPRQRDPQVKGLAYVYFFPQGQADPAQIPVVDGDNVYTVVLQPLTGHAKVVNGRPEVPR